MHDKCADTCNRVAWVHTENMHTHDPVQAWKIMAYTARAQSRLKEAAGCSRAGRKLEKAVFAFSLAWHPEQSPDQEHMLETAQKAIAALGLSEHEHVIVSHRDEPQKHVHIIVNRVHPITGRAGDIRNSKRKMSDFARIYQQERGENYCPQREENHKRREKGEKTHYSDRHIVEAWENTKTGEAFAAALKERGCTLARGHKRIVIIDPHGKTHNPARLLKDVKAKDIRARLSDIDVSKLPIANDHAPEPEAKTNEPDREKQRADFEHAAGKQLQALHHKHRAELETLALQHSRRVNHTKKQLAEYYGLPKRKKAIVATIEKMRSASWLHKLLGVTRKDRKTYREQVKVYNKAVRLYREKLAGIQAQNTKDTQNLKSRQVDAFRKLEFQIEMQRSTGDYTSSRGGTGQRADRKPARAGVFQRSGNGGRKKS